MQIPIYQVDAFTDTLFRGNPAAVCLPEASLSEETMLAIAAENKLSETAFCVRGSGGYTLRWFSPTMEIDLCGHATLATAFVLCEVLARERHGPTFHTASGELRTVRSGNTYSLYLPRREAETCEPPAALLEGLGTPPREVRRSGNDYLAVYERQEQVSSLSPVMSALAELPGAVIITAPAALRESDFVSRVFAPAEGIPEDPVTGSAHCTLVPYWRERLGGDYFRAHQISARGGRLFCWDRGERIEINGEAVLYMRGTIEL